MKQIKTKTLERSSYFATIAVAVVGICALLVGVYQFSETQKQQRETLELEREAKAVELFVKYNDLMREAAAQKSHESTEAVFWRNNLSIAIVESIWNLTIGDSGWENTVKGMLLDQDKIQRIDDLDCSTYNTDFVEFARRALNHEVC